MDISLLLSAATSPPRSPPGSPVSSHSTLPPRTHHGRRTEPITRFALSSRPSATARTATSHWATTPATASPSALSPLSRADIPPPLNLGPSLGAPSALQPGQHPVPTTFGTPFSATRPSPISTTTPRVPSFCAAPVSPAAMHLGPSAAPASLPLLPPPEVVNARAVGVPTAVQPDAAAAAVTTPPSKPFSCTHAGCGATFGQKGSLTRHVKNVHSTSARSSRLHACDSCGKAFSERWTLLVHVRNVHLKLRAHSCPHCGKAFGEKWNLRKHVNVVHLRVRPFACPVCARAFGYKGDMLKHVAELHRASDAARPYACATPGCGVKFARLRYLRRHQNTAQHHPGEEEELAAAQRRREGLAAEQRGECEVTVGDKNMTVQDDTQRQQYDGAQRNLELFAAVVSERPPQRCQE